MNHADINISFLKNAAFQISKVSLDLSLTTRLLVARENLRQLEDEVRNTKAGANRSIANEKRCEALAIVLDIEAKIKDQLET